MNPLEEAGAWLRAHLPWSLDEWGTTEWIVFCSLVLLFLIGCLGSRAWAQRVRQQAPAMMTSIGILGTFVGIYEALQSANFSPPGLTASVFDLVDSMKTAFLTSLMGLGAAILFRITISLGWHRKAPSSQVEDRLLAVLSDIRTAIVGKDDDSLTDQISALRLNVKDSGSAQEIRLEALLQAVAGTGDRSVAGRLDKMRLDVTERLDMLRVIQADGFGKLNTLTETIRETLVENLQELIAELNASVGEEFRESLNRLVQDIEQALIEQFGKTFVEFNEATQALKKWQEDHRAQVEELTAAFNLAATNIESIAQNCALIPATMDRLQDGMSMARHDVEVLNRQLEAFASLREQAEQSFPLIKQNLDAIGDDLRKSAEGFNGAKEVIENAFREAQASAMRTMQTHAANVDQMAASMKETIVEAQRESAEKALGTIRTSMATFSQESQTALQTILRDWGGNMIAIAERCKELIDSVQTRRI